MDSKLARTFQEMVEEEERKWREEVKAKEAAKRKKEEMKAAKQAFEKHLLERELRKAQKLQQSSQKSPSPSLADRSSATDGDTAADEDHSSSSPPNLSSSSQKDLAPAIDVSINEPPKEDVSGQTRFFFHFKKKNEEPEVPPEARPIELLTPPLEMFLQNRLSSKPSFSSVRGGELLLEERVSLPAEAGGTIMRTRSMGMRDFEDQPTTQSRQPRSSPGGFVPVLRPASFRVEQSASSNASGGRAVSRSTSFNAGNSGTAQLSRSTSFNAGNSGTAQLSRSTSMTGDGSLSRSTSFSVGRGLPRSAGLSHRASVP